MKLFLILFLVIICFNRLKAQTYFMTGDIAVVGLNANNATSCGDSSGTDIISFVCFKDFTTGTTLDITDNGYERIYPGLWGDTEGTYRATRTGGTISAGTVITFKIKSGIFSCIYPDANWTFNSINGGWNNVNMNSGGDQLFFMQNGIWSGYTDTIPQNATYLGGNILFGFNTRTTWAANGTTQQSNLTPNMDCFNMAPTSGASDFIKYTGSMTDTTQKGWISRISNYLNWTKYTSCTLFNSALPDYPAGVTFVITEFFDVDAGLNDTVCQNQAAFALGGIPSGGYWTGTGITDTSAGLFDPAVSGAGNIYVTYIFNDAGCSYNDLKTVVVNPESVISINSGTGDVCEGTDLNIVGSITGGTAPFTQLWTGDTTFLNNAAILNPVFNSQATGNYNFTLTVTDSKGCIGTNSLSVNVNPNPAVVISPFSLQICANEDTILTATPSGGSLVYSTHLWTGNTSILTSSLNLPDVTLNSGTAGSYNLTYTVTDSKGCSGTSSIPVTINPNPLITITPTSQAICSGVASGILLNSDILGTNFSWTVIQNGVTGATAGNGTSIAQTLTYTAAPGTATYTITGTDANNCSNTNQVIVTVNALPTVDAGIAQTVCSGTTVTLSGSGASSYVWDNGITNGTSFTPLSTTTYNVTGTDANNCSNTDQVIVTVNTLPTVDAGIAQTVCSGTLVTLSGSGATSYIWDNGITNGTSFTPLSTTTYNVTGTDTNNCSNTDQVIITVNVLPIITAIPSSQTLCSDESTNVTLSSSVGGTIFSWTVLQTGVTGGTAGSGTSIAQTLTYIAVPGTATYTITGTANSCSGDTNITITVNPLPVIISAIKTDVTICGGSDGTITINSSGAAPLSYSIDGGLLFDSNNGIFSGLIAGNYQTAVKNAFGCITIGTLLIVSAGGAPSPPVAGTNATYCQGVAASNLTATAGSSGTLTWYSNPGLTNQIDTGSTLNPNPYLTVGTNNFYTTETVSGCESVSTMVTITVNALPVPGTTVTANILCFGENTGSVTATASGGQPPYSFLWENNVFIPPTITGLSANIYYSFIVTDAANCSASDSIILTQPEALLLNIALSPVKCKGESNGNATAIVTGGTQPYAYSWSNSTIGSSINNIPAGSFSLTITDNNNCTTSDSIMLTEPALAILLNVSPINGTCGGSNSNGSVHTSTTGGTPPYSFLWSNNQTDSVAVNLTAGTYQVTVSDINNCKDSSSVVIMIPDAILLNVDTTKNITSCKDNADAGLFLTVSGGTEPYIYLWSEGSTNKDILNLSKGEYTVTVIDSLSCSISKTFEVKSMSSSCLEIPSAFTPNSDGNNDTWEIKHIELYPNAKVEIFNRWGNVIFETDGYSQAWDGKYNGTDVTSGPYIYIINLNNGFEIYKGIVTVIR